MNKQPEYLFQGEDLTNNREGFKFKIQFDKLFSLMQEFYVKIRGVNTRLNDNLNAELDQEFINLVDKTTPKLKDKINTSITLWIK